jgi:hypothetical protein
MIRPDAKRIVAFMANAKFAYRSDLDFIRVSVRLNANRLRMIDKPEAAVSAAVFPSLPYPTIIGLFDLDLNSE